MTVAELIEQLKALPQDAVVVRTDSDLEMGTATSIHVHEKPFAWDYSDGAYRRQFDLAVEVL